MIISVTTDSFRWKPGGRFPFKVAPGQHTAPAPGRREALCNDGDASVQTSQICGHGTHPYRPHMWVLWDRPRVLCLTVAGPGELRADSGPLSEWWTVSLARQKCPCRRGRILGWPEEVPATGPHVQRSEGVRASVAPGRGEDSLLSICWEWEACQDACPCA